MRFTKYIIPAGAILLAFAGCDQAAEQSAHMDHGDHDMTAMGESASNAPKVGLDYKAMFGPNYKRGDVGHSTGTVMSVVPDKGYITIDHGMIHGIDMGAMTMAFKVLDDADLSGIDAGTQVEFLVKKGDDGNFGVFALCNMDELGDQCLQKTFG